MAHVEIAAEDQRIGVVVAAIDEGRCFERLAVMGGKMARRGYRLAMDGYDPGDDELDELGFEEMARDGIVFVEWPQNAPSALAARGQARCAACSQRRRSWLKPGRMMVGMPMPTATGDSDKAIRATLFT